MTRSPFLINVRPVADHYAGANERTVEFTSTDGRGGLITFAATPDNPAYAVHVAVHRTDPGVLVTHTTTEPTGRCELAATYGALPSTLTSDQARAIVAAMPAETRATLAAALGGADDGPGDLRPKPDHPTPDHRPN
jgi:hypothetical protein